MGKIYKRECDYCGKYYEGYGRLFCSPNCKHKGIKKRKQGRYCDKCGKYYESNGKHFCSNLCSGKGIPVADRFWSKVKINDETGCWEWQADIDQQGYGVFYVDGKSKRVHRAGWEMVFEKIPEGNILHHKCNNEKCVNYFPLTLSTYKGNAEERDKAGRQASRKGELNGQALLSENDVREIKLDLNNGVPQRKIAIKFHVSQQHISAISTKKKWKHIQ
jgi:hypothetical protein